MPRGKKNAFVHFLSLLSKTWRTSRRISQLNNYGNIPKNKNGITKLIKMLDMMANKNKDHEYLVYQRNKYHNIPLWVIMNTLTFGQISKMF